MPRVALLSSRLTSQVAWYAIGLFTQALATMFALRLLSGKLSYEAFAEYSVLEGALLVTIPLVTLRVDAFVSVRYFRCDIIEFRKSVSSALVLSLFSFVVLSAVIILLLNQPFLSLPLSGSLLIWVPAVALLRVPGMLLLAILRAVRKARAFSFYLVLQAGLDLTLLWLFVEPLSLGVEGRLMSWLISSGLLATLALCVIQKKGYWAKPAKEEVLRGLAFCFPLLPYALFASILATSGRFFAKANLSSIEVSHYTAAYKLAGLLLLTSTVLNQIWAPELFSLIKQRRFDQVRAKYTLLCGASAFFALMIALFGERLFAILLEGSFGAAEQYLLLILVAFFFQSCHQFISNVLLYYGKTALLAKVAFFAVLVNVLTNAFFISSHGVWAAVTANAISWAIFLLLTASISFSLMRSAQDRYSKTNG